MVTSGGRRDERLDAALGHADKHVVEDPHGLSWHVEFVRRVGVSVDGIDEVPVLILVGEGVGVENRSIRADADLLRAEDARAGHVWAQHAGDRSRR